MLIKMMLNLLKGILALATTLTPAAVPSVLTVAAIGGSVAVTAGCADTGDDNDDGDDDGDDD